MRATAPVRAATMRLPRRAVAITACFLSVLLFAMQVTNAAACFATADASTVPAQLAVPGYGEWATDVQKLETAALVSPSFYPTGGSGLQLDATGAQPSRSPYRCEPPPAVRST